MSVAALFDFQHLPSVHIAVRVKDTHLRRKGSVFLSDEPFCKEVGRLYVCGEIL
jgi:hypothetical protein